MIDIDEECMKKVRQVIKPLGIEKVRAKCLSYSSKNCPARCPYSIFDGRKTDCMFKLLCPASWEAEGD